MMLVSPPQLVEELAVLRGFATSDAQGSGSEAVERFILCVCECLPEVMGRVWRFRVAAQRQLSDSFFPFFS